MLPRFALVSALLLPLVSPPACPETPSDELLRKIRKHAADDLAGLPNYTCRQTIERSVRPAESQKFQPLDLIRLEVALIGEKELYSWPGSARFEEKRIDQIVAKGAIGSGHFAVHARNLFVRNVAEFTYRGEGKINARKAVRFDFRIPQERSGYAVYDSTNGAYVEYSGSFWADSATLDLLRLEIRVDKVPPPVQVIRSSSTVDYARVRIGESTFLLPQSAEMSMLAPMGETRNRMRFDNCRQYVGESVLSFGEPAAGVETPKPVEFIKLPAGLEAEMTLETPVRAGETAVGDPAIAVLAKALRSKEGKPLLPKGARLKGRLTRIERYLRPPVEYSVIGVMFESVEAEGVRADFAGTLESAGIADRGAYYVPYRNDPGEPFTVWTHFRHQTARPQPNEGVFYVRGSQLRLAAGLRMLWRTGLAVR